MWLYLHLPPQLVLHSCFLQLLLEQHFECQDELGLAFPGQIHAPELAFAQSAADVEVLQAPGFPKEPESTAGLNTTRLSRL